MEQLKHRDGPIATLGTAGTHLMETQPAAHVDCRPKVNVRVEKLLASLKEFYPEQLFVSRGRGLTRDDYRWELWTRDRDGGIVRVAQGDFVRDLFKDAKMRAIRIAVRIANEEKS